MNERQALPQVQILEQSTFEQRQTGEALAKLWGAIAAFVLGLTIIMLIVARDVILLFAGVFGYLLMVLLAGVLVIVIVASVYRLVSHIRHKARMQELDAQKAEVEIELKRHQTRQLHPDMTGNYPAYVDGYGRIIQLSPGNYVQPVYHTFSPHYAYHNNVEGGQAQEDAVPEVAAHIPSFAELLEAGKFGKGEMIIGVRANGEVRYGEWNDLMIFGVWGGSHSGKTTTVAEKACEAAIGGAYLIICDPHAQKNDSLTRKIQPLIHVLYPGTKIAMHHTDILHNVERANDILEARVKGADCSKPVVLIVEEWNRLQRDEDIRKALTKVVKAIGQEGRGFNVFAVIAGQETSGESEVRKALIAHIVHRIPESESTKVLPTRVAKETPLLPVGCSIILDSDGMLEKLYQPLLRVEDVMAVAAMTGGIGVSIRVDEPSSAPSSRPSPNHLPEIPEMTSAHTNFQQGGKSPEDGFSVSPERLSLVRKMLAEQKKQTEIIRLVWGIETTAGRAYEQAAKEYRAIVALIVKEEGVA